MKDSKRKMIVRIVCLLVALFMIVTVFSSVFFSLASM